MGRIPIDGSVMYLHIAVSSIIAWGVPGLRLGVYGFVSGEPKFLQNISTLKSEDPEYRILITGYWILDTGYWILDTGYWMLGAFLGGRPSFSWLGWVCNR